MAKAKKKIIKPKAGQHPIEFQPGGLHRSLGVPSGSRIPKTQMVAALAGSYGARAKKQANFKKNVLTGGRGKRGKR